MRVGRPNFAWQISTFLLHIYNRRHHHHQHHHLHVESESTGVNDHNCPHQTILIINQFSIIQWPSSWSDYMRVRALPYRRSSRRTSRFNIFSECIIMHYKYPFLFYIFFTSFPNAPSPILFNHFYTFPKYFTPHLFHMKYPPINIIILLVTSSSSSMGSSLSRSVKTVRECFCQIVIFVSFHCWWDFRFSNF